MTTAEQKLQELKIRLLEISDLNNINALLGWDQSTYMPPRWSRGTRTPVCKVGANGAGKVRG